MKKIITVNLEFVTEPTVRYLLVDHIAYFGFALQNSQQVNHIWMSNGEVMSVKENPVEIMRLMQGIEDNASF